MVHAYGSFSHDMLYCEIAHVSSELIKITVLNILVMAQGHFLVRTFPFVRTLVSWLVDERRDRV